jgi:hypothetical protein
MHVVSFATVYDFDDVIGIEPIVWRPARAALAVLHRHTAIASSRLYGIAPTSIFGTVIEARLGLWLIANDLAVKLRN